MDACSLEEIQNLFISYHACFSRYFPELGFFCNEKEFHVHGIIRKTPTPSADHLTRCKKYSPKRSTFVTSI